MSKILFALLAVGALVACSKGGTASTDEPHYLSNAVDGATLVIPVQIEDPARLPARFQRVEGKATRASQTLIEAVFTCPIPLIWIDRTVDHWGAIVFPSERSSFWPENAPRLSDSEMISCIQSRTSATFFVARSPKGFDTNDLGLLNENEVGR